MSHETIEKKIIRKKLITRLVILVLYLFILLYFFYLFIEFNANPFIIILLIIFIFLTILGPFLKRNKGSLYSRMFPDRKRKPNLSYQKKKITIIPENESKQPQQKIFKSVDLNHNYRKPIINKCENCGNIVPNFVKTCPFCKKPIT